MKVVIEDRRALVPPPFPPALFGLARKLEGRSAWPKTGGLSFEPTPFNLRLLREAFPDLETEDRRKALAGYGAKTPFPGAGMGQERLPGSGQGKAHPAVRYASRTTPFGPYQAEATMKGLGLEFFGLFMEQGTGKSKVAVDIAGERFCRGEIGAVLIMAFNGVHHQWIEEAFPDHIGPMVEWCGWAYVPGRKLPQWVLTTTRKLVVLTINFESVNSKEGRRMINAFVEAHADRGILGIVDEGQRIKNPDAKSSVEIQELAPYCSYRMDLTGTPIVKDLTDVWSQFKWLDPNGEANLGHRYKKTFQAEFCRMHRTIRGMVIGSKKEEEFYRRIAPYIFRITKAEALPDLPPKVYDRYVFELHPEQRKLYEEMKATFLAKIDTGEVATVKNALTLVLRLQQITCGYLALDKDDPDEATKFALLPNPRMDALKRVLAQRQGKKVIWCRFTKDIELGLEQSNHAVSYYGGNGRDEKQENKRAFIENEDITELWSNPAAGGTGVDGLQKVARTAIYYSNSYNSVHRWQSEDRIDRIGMGAGNSTYIDLIARGTVDLPILANLKRKKQLADFVLDDIRKLLMTEGE